MSNLKRVCQEVIEAGKVEYGNPNFPKYINISVLNSDKLARACLVMEEALKHIAQTGLAEDRSRCAIAIAQVEEIFK